MKNSFILGMRSTSPSPMSRTSAQRADVVGEQPVQDVGRHAHLHRVEAPPALVALQHVERADILAEPVGLDDRFGQRRGILEAEIEALAGNRVDAVRGVARQREARPDEIARQRQPERPGARLVLDADLAELEAEAPLQLDLEDDQSSADQPVGIGGALGPDDRGAVAVLVGLSGRMANGPAGRKCSSARPSCGRSWPRCRRCRTGRNPSSRS